MMNVILEPNGIRNKRFLRSPSDNFASNLARFILGGLFVYSGLDNLMNLFVTADKLALPAAVLLVALAGIFKMGMGTALALRYHTKYAAISLAAYILLATLIFYGPQHWNEQEIYQYIFMRNIAIFAGLLFVEANSRGFAFWQDIFITKSEKKLLQEGEKNQPPHP